MTTIASTRTASATDVAKAAADLLPVIVARAEEIEEMRRLPTDLLDQLIGAGVFRMLLPTRCGGIEATLPAAMEVVEMLSGADASVGWTVMIGSGSWIDLAGLPSDTFDALYANGPDVIIAGAFAPTGQAIPVESGFRVSGRWAFASGSPHADWIFGNCVQPTDAAPRLRICLFALDEANIEDTWHVLGLRGTASHHFHVDNVVVPADRTCLPLEEHPQLDATIVRLPPPSTFSMMIASMTLGVARAALDDIGLLATTRTPLLSPGPLAVSPTFLYHLATADTDLRAARALLYEVAEDAWQTASDHRELSLEQRAHIRAAAVRATETALAVVTAAYRAGGSDALYLQSPLQRRLRDIHTAAQHFLVRDDTMTAAGKALTGEEPDVPIF